MTEQSRFTNDRWGATASFDSVGDDETRDSTSQENGNGNEAADHTTGEAVQQDSTLHIDEFGSHKNREYDLHATQKLLIDRSRPLLGTHPERVGNYERQAGRYDYTANYVREGVFTDAHGETITKRVLRVFPAGPYLHRWTVGIDEWYEDGGEVHRNHRDAIGCADLSTALATTLAVLRDEIPADRNGS